MNADVLFDMAGINKDEARELMFKVSESVDLKDFTPKEHRLISVSYTHLRAHET